MKYHRYIKLTVSFILIFVSVMSAQGKIRSFGQKEIDNLIVGLKSENYGLRNSAIQLAGKYFVKESAPVVRDILKSSNDSDEKILAASVLLRINDGFGMRLVKKLADSDSDERVRSMSDALYRTYLLHKREGFL